MASLLSLNATTNMICTITNQNLHIDGLVNAMVDRWDP